VRTGIAASDPTLLPVGSVISINTGDSKYSGIYTIMDTGPAVQGRILDLYMWSCHEALAFGRKDVQVTVLRLGWNPRASTPGLVDTLFRKREAAPRPARPESDAAPAGGQGAPAAQPAPTLAASEGAEAEPDALPPVELATKPVQQTP
jgi:hypothetical protein